MRAPHQPLRLFHILVVEDHDDSRDILDQILRHAGAAVTAVANARDALLMAGVVDAIVTDLAMPDADGRWLLAQIEARQYRVPVIAVTDHLEHYHDLLGARFTRVLKKPIDPDRLVAELLDVIRR